MKKKVYMETPSVGKIFKIEPEQKIWNQNNLSQTAFDFKKIDPYGRWFFSHKRSFANIVLNFLNFLSQNPFKLPK